MSRNEITGDAITTGASTDAFREGHELIWGKKAPAETPFRCVFCGAPSWVDPSDQSPPPDYCHESDHGSADE